MAGHEGFLVQMETDRYSPIPIGTKGIVIEQRFRDPMGMMFDIEWLDIDFTVKVPGNRLTVKASTVSIVQGIIGLSHG